LAVAGGEIQYDDSLAGAILKHERSFEQALADPGVPVRIEERQFALIDMSTYLAFCLIPALSQANRYCDAVILTRQFLHRLTWAGHRNVLGAGRATPGDGVGTRFLNLGPPM